MRVTCWPFGVLNTTVASVMPAASDCLISATFQLSSWFQPNIFLRKESTVASLGSELLPLVDLAAVAGFEELVPWAKQFRLAAQRPAIRTVRVKTFMVPFEENRQLATSN